MDNTRIYSIAKQGTHLFDVKNNRRTAIIMWILLAVACVIGYRFFINHATSDITQADNLRTVKLATISALSSGNSSLSIVGTVSSESQATLHAEKGGQVVALYHKIGDQVRAGDVIAILEHDSESASIQQAQAAVAVAQANYNKITDGARTEQKTILESSAKNAQDSLQSTKVSTVNTILSAYQTIESSVTGVADSMISNPTSVSPIFVVTTSNSQVVNDIQSKRVALQQIVINERALRQSIATTDNLASDITNTESDVRTTISLMDSLVQALSSAIPTTQIPATTIAADLASVNTSRSQLTGILSTLSGMQDALNGKNTALVVAQQNLAQGVTGGQPEDVAAGQAALQQAQAGLASAEAAYEHAVIRAPISGSISMINLKLGDYATAYTPVVTISNDNGLEIVAYVSSTDLSSISVGTTADLGTDASGTVTRLSSVIDPTSKQAEVHIGVTRQGSLVSGQSTIVSFERPATSNVASNASTSTTMIVPLSAIKVGSDNMSVFTLSASSTLVAHTVTLGTLLGDRVVIKDGVTPNMSIVVDARGLRDGEKVSIQ